mmetsp:Transcript_7883/g.19464  ORF Transcript_7883/g.19464 Transcript_7883/m.19464 type:complete len:246 (+) Transcript_7883:3012-3749(+)
MAIRSRTIAPPAVRCAGQGRNHGMFVSSSWRARAGAPKYGASRSYIAHTEPLSVAWLVWGAIVGWSAGSESRTRDSKAGSVDSLPRRKGIADRMGGITSEQSRKGALRTPALPTRWQHTSGTSNSSMGSIASITPKSSDVIVVEPRLKNARHSMVSRGSSACPTAQLCADESRWSRAMPATRTSTTSVINLRRRCDGAVVLATKKRSESSRTKTSAMAASRPASLSLSSTATTAKSQTSPAACCR